MKNRCKNILIIDDEVGPRESLKVILKDQYVLGFAESGKEGLRKSVETNPDLVILDIKMPDVNGVEVLKKIKKTKPDVEVIMLTGYGSYDSAQAAIRHGAFDYIDKPFDVNRIRDVVRKAMRRRRLALESQRDLDELRNINMELEMELLHMSKLAQTGKLTASAMHEISNPLTAVFGYIEVLQNLLQKGASLKEKDYENSRRYLSVMERAIDRCSKFISNQLSYSRKPSNSIEETSLGEAIESLVLLIKPQARSQGVTVEAEVTGKSTKVRCNPDEFQHALMNIIFNAIEAMPDGGELRATCNVLPAQASRHEVTKLGIIGLANRPYVLTSIADTGKGISPGDLSRIFDPFFTHKNKKRGTGLGLPYAKKVIEKYGGAIGVESTVGAGTTFHLFLPTIKG